MNELFWSASDREREDGYLLNGEIYSCLLCKYKTEVGYIYPKGDLYVDAKKQMILHIEEEHGGVFDYLIKQGKKISGISEHQSKIIRLFYDGVSDYDIQKELDLGSISTVRNHRYALKEKEKQAKTFLTIMSTLSKVSGNDNQIIKPHKTATMLDDRYSTTLSES